MEHLSKEFWSNCYQKDNTGWDIGEISTPIKAYFDQVATKNLKILIPGCGNGYEAEYLVKSGFTNVNILDFAQEPLIQFQKRNKDFPKAQIHQGDFFKHEGRYDLVVEQTLFCAVDPALRQQYADRVSQLLKPQGKLIGVLFNREFESGPPYGGTKGEYLSYFSNQFGKVVIAECYNSIAPRKNSEFFIKMIKV
jgi:methyl halide transferase